MLGLGAESIVHGLICATAVVVLLRWRRQDGPSTRLHCIAVALLLPALLTPALRLLIAARLTPGFRDGPALLSASHFLAWREAGLLVLAILALLGALLFLRDLIPFVRDLMRGRPGEQAHEGPAVQAAQRAAERLGVPVPPIFEMKHAGPVLLCRGWNPRVVVSAALVQALTPQELEAALAHEVAHAARRDPRLGWGLMLVRALCFWNPAVQLLGRWAVRELERRADQVAAGVLGDARPVVSSLRRMADMSTGADSWLRRDIEARCRAVQVPQAPSRQSWPWALAVGLALVIFLVVA